MSSDPRLAALPAVKRLAEEQAREHAAACESSFAIHMGADTPAMYERGWDAMHEDEQDALVAAHLALLSDLSRPASRDAVARLVAEAVGLDTTGGVIVTPTAHRRAKIRDWIVEDWNGATYAAIRASKVTDPTEALTLTALHTLGAPHA